MTRTQTGTRPSRLAVGGESCSSAQRSTRDATRTLSGRPRIKLVRWSWRRTRVVTKNILPSLAQPTARGPSARHYGRHVRSIVDQTIQLELKPSSSLAAEDVGRRVIRLGSPSAGLQRSVVIRTCSVLLLLTSTLIGSMTWAAPVEAAASSASYRCTPLISVQTLKSITGRKYVPSPTNAAQQGTRVNCVFTPLPRYSMPPAMRHGELTLTLSSRPVDAAKLRRSYAGRLHRLNGLGSSVIETVSSTGMQQIVAIGPHFAFTLRAYGPMGFPMEEQIARHIYATVIRSPS